MTGDPFGGSYFARPRGWSLDVTPTQHSLGSDESPAEQQPTDGHQVTLLGSYLRELCHLGVRRPPSHD
jgi:hypothetical protein